MNTIVIETEDVKLSASLNNSTTAKSILEALPFEGQANVWGDEIYFTIPVQLEQEPDARVEVEVGELGYWPVGSAFCIFFGPTPVSSDEKPRAYSPVNIFGKVEGDATLFKGVANGATVKVSKQ
jgi:hypothetical protein